MQLFVAFVKTHKTMFLKRIYFIVCKLYTIEKKFLNILRKVSALYKRTSSSYLYLTVEVAFMCHKDTKTYSKSGMFLTACVFPPPSIPV